MRTHGKFYDAFTLIELLIVVAIIAILAAIAVPNFLEAQTRAKVSRVKADFRGLAVALESYSTDYNHYPVSWGIQQNTYYPSNAQTLAISLWVLTSPTPYMNNVVLYDPFGLNQPSSVITGIKTRAYYEYFMLLELVGPDYLKTITFGGITDTAHEYAAMINNEMELSGLPRKEYDHPAYALWSAGPDRLPYSPHYDQPSSGWYTLVFAESAKPGDSRGFGPGEAWINRLYDPTNGTISDGDMWRRGGEILNTAVPDN